MSVSSPQPLSPILVRMTSSTKYNRCIIDDRNDCCDCCGIVTRPQVSFARVWPTFIKERDHKYRFRLQQAHIDRTLIRPLQQVIEWTRSKSTVCCYRPSGGRSRRRLGQRGGIDQLGWHLQVSPHKRDLRTTGEQRSIGQGTEKLNKRVMWMCGVCISIKNSKDGDETNSSCTSGP